MKSKIVMAIVILFLATGVKAQKVFTNLKDAQAVAIATNKPILLVVWKTGKEVDKFANILWKEEPEIKELLENFVVLELLGDNFYSKDYQSIRVQNNFAIIGNVLDAIGNVIGNVRYSPLKYEKSNRRLNNFRFSLKENSLEMSLFQEEYRAIVSTNSVSDKVFLIEKYLNYSLYLKNEESKRNFIYVAGKYIKEIQKENKEGNALPADMKQRFRLLDFYNRILNKKYKRAAKSLNKMELSSLEESNKSFFYYISYLANNKAKKKEIAKTWFYKLKTRSDFNFYYLMSRKF